MTSTVAFDTTVTATGNNTGIVVPEDVIERVGGGKRPAVVVKVNRYEYRNTVGTIGGKFTISISAAVRKETGLSAGDAIRVTLALAETPREVTVPDDFAAALSAEPGSAAFFAELPNSLQRYHVDNVNRAKTAETRQPRIGKAISLFQEGRQR